LLNLIKSNSIELITEVLAKELLLNPPSVTERLDISVDDYFLSKWIRDQITIKNKISALYEFKKINTLTEDLIKKLYPDNNFDIWNYDSLIWHIINSLEELFKFEESFPLRPWINKYTFGKKTINKDIYILCNKIARIFSDYQVYRPEMIINWHKFDLGKDNLFYGLEKNEFWQPVLFKIIEKKIICKSKAYFIIDFINNIQNRKININEFIPRQIYIVSINNLSKLQISFYQKLSEYTRVNIYQLSYGYDLWNRLNIDDCNNLRKDNKNFKIETIEGIFAKYGSDSEKLFDETISNLQIEINYQPFYSNPEIKDKLERISLLHQLQRKIIDNNQKKLKIFTNDKSFCLYAHYDIIHQLEFVRNNIIDLVENNHEIKFSDIAIASPNLENLIPHIKSIFDDEFLNGQKIPYLLTNKKYIQISNIFRLIIEYFDLASSKITIEKLNSFLNDNCIKQIFDISTKDIDEIILVLQECGFDWGLDSQERSGEFMNNLDWCIQRITLGMIYDEEIFMDKNNICSFVSNNSNLDFHKWINILNIFKSDVNSLRGSFTFKDWVGKIKTILLKFRSNSDNYSDEINEINIILDNQEKQVLSKDLIDIYVVKDILLNCFNKPNNILTNRNNQILIGNLSSIRLIPHKIIFLIDVNNIFFPKKFIEEKINLINKFFIFGDLVKSDKEKYLFLELLMSCREKFIISWSNFDKNNNKLEVSTPIRQLIYYLENKILNIKNYEIINNIENKKSFDFKKSKKIIDKKYSLIKKIEWSLKEHKEKEFKLSELTYWFSEPQIYWLRKNNLYFGNRFVNNPSDEYISGFQKTKLFNNLIRNIKFDNPHLIKELTNANIKEYLIRNGIFAPGNSINLKENELKEILYSLLDKLSDFKKINKLYLDKDTNREEYFVSNNAIIELINSNLNVNKISQAWIRLLFASSIDSSIKGAKIIYRLNNQYRIKEIISPGSLESKELLIKYINIHKTAIEICWPIPPESSFCFIEAKYYQKNAENAFIKSWLGIDGFKEGESNKPEMRFCFGEDTPPEFFINQEQFVKLSSEIYLPLISSLKK
tara:strand:- start:1764 stop:4934 length:3171 start_codon:yes stop_codon:yes gene_type:complete